MTVRDTDVDYTFDDPDKGWFGAAQPADVEPEPQPHPALAEDDTDRWFVPDVNPTAPTATESFGFVGTPEPPTWESRLSNSGAWDFKATPGQRQHRSKVVLMAAAIVAAVAAIVGVVLVLLTPADQEASPVPTSESAAPPTPPTSAAPELSSAAPLPPLPPPLPPPPPPPSAQQVNPPVTRQYTPSYQTPDEPRKPQTNVTRAPLSATPPPPPRPTDRGRATPGESGSHGFFG